MYNCTGLHGADLYCSPQAVPKQSSTSPQTIPNQSPTNRSAVLRLLMCSFSIAGCLHYVTTPSCVANAGAVRVAHLTARCSQLLTPACCSSIHSICNLQPHSSDVLVSANASSSSSYAGSTGKAGPFGRHSSVMFSASSLLAVFMFTCQFLGSQCAFSLECSILFVPACYVSLLAHVGPQDCKCNLTCKCDLT